MARPGAVRYVRPDDDVCAVPSCDQPLDQVGARCHHHRVHGHESAYQPTARRRPAEHGEYLSYRRGCRCDACRTANARRAAAFKARS